MNECVVYIHPHQRFRISIEESHDLGYGLWRSEEMAELGFQDSEEDAKEFAKSLLDALSDQMSFHTLLFFKHAVDEKLRAWK